MLLGWLVPLIFNPPHLSHFNTLFKISGVVGSLQNQLIIRTISSTNLSPSDQGKTLIFPVLIPFKQFSKLRCKMKTCIFKLILITYFKSYYNLKIFPNFQNFAFKKSKLDIYIGYMEI